MGIKTGVDIVFIPRFVNETQGASIDKIFVPQEIEGRNIESLAGMFAAKEATIKALNLASGSWHSIEILQEESGRPRISLASYLLAGKHFISSDVSISHDGDYAVAVAVFYFED